MLSSPLARRHVHRALRRHALGEFRIVLRRVGKDQLWSFAYSPVAADLFELGEATMVLHVVNDHEIRCQEQRNRDLCVFRVGVRQQRSTLFPAHRDGVERRFWANEKEWRPLADCRQYVTVTRFRESESWCFVGWEHNVLCFQPLATVSEQPGET
jgi:hypothetical protein